MAGVDSFVVFLVLDTQRVNPKGAAQDGGLIDGDIIEWDGQHGEFERYKPRGKHIGVWDPPGESRRKLPLSSYIRI
jgi:hypothetical protein